MRNKVYFTIRLSEQEAQAMDALAEARGCTRSEACRVAMRAGAPLVKDNFAVNMTRFAEVLEGIGAGMSVILMRDHPDYADTVDEVTLARLERFHA